MANATARLAKGARSYPEVQFIDHSADTLTVATRFYEHAMLGLTTGGYLAKFDDTQSLQFYGLVRQKESNPLLPIGTAGDGTIDLPVHQAPAFELAITSIAITDIGKKVYALFDNAGTLDVSATTYGNLIGIVKDLVFATTPGTTVTSIALVEPVYDGKAANARLGAARWMAATGNQTLYKHDLNKTIFLPNTGIFTLTLPAIATTQAGDRLTFVKTTADAAAVTLDGNAAETVEGGANLASIDAAYDTAILVSTGVEWVVIARDIT